MNKNAYMMVFLFFSFCIDEVGKLYYFCRNTEMKQNTVWVLFCHDNINIKEKTIICILIFQSSSMESCFALILRSKSKFLWPILEKKKSAFNGKNYSDMNLLSIAKQKWVS